MRVYFMFSLTVNYKWGGGIYNNSLNIKSEDKQFGEWM